MHLNVSVDYFKSSRISFTIKHKTEHPSIAAWVFVYNPINLNTLKAVINTRIDIKAR